MINAIGTYVGHFKRTFDGDSIQELSNTVQFLEEAPSGTTWPDSQGDYIAPSGHQWEGACYHFDGVNDRVDISSSPDLKNPNFFTISLWIKFDTLTSAMIPLAKDGDSGYYIQIGTNGSVYFRFGSGATTLISSGSIITGNWYNIVFTFDGTNGTAYLNNTEKTSSSNFSAPTSMTDNDLVMGCYSSKASYFIDGKMFDVRIYNKALSFSEITDLYNHKPVALSNLVAHYKMDEAAGTTAFDSSGNDNHGTITNATLSTFHGTQNEYSFANEVGYTTGNGSNGAAVGVNIPRNESNTLQDVLENTLEYSGRVKYDAQLVESHCATFDGTNDYISMGSRPTVNQFTFSCKIRTTSTALSNLVSGESAGQYISISAGKAQVYDGVTWRLASAVINDGLEHHVLFSFDSGEWSIWVDGALGYNGSEGTYTNGSLIVIAVFRNLTIRFFNGNMWDVKISHSVETPTSIETASLVSSYSMAEGAGNTHYDGSGNGNDGTAINITEATYWGSTQDVYHANILNGYTLYEHATLDPIYVPYGNNSNPLSITPPEGFTKTADYPAGAWHNKAETKLKQHNAPALLQADEADDFWFNSSDVAQSKSYTDIVNNVNSGNRIMADISIMNQKKNFLMFDPALTDPNLSDVKEFLNH